MELQVRVGIRVEGDEQSIDGYGLWLVRVASACGCWWRFPETPHAGRSDLFTRGSPS